MTVNPVYIDQFVGPLIGGADSEEEIGKFASFNSNNENEVKQLAKDVLLPAFEKRIKPFKVEMKNSLAYYLKYNKVDFESIIDSLLLPIETPKDPLLFFHWLWEVFFEGEHYDFILKENVIEEFEVEAPLNLMKRYKKNS